jgi:predicted DNA-binding protein YlxM (UPF0122 family)
MSEKYKTSLITDNIIKIQKKLATFEKGSRNYKKYTKILRKHIKNNNMKNRIKSDINSIEQIKKLSGY